MYLYEVGIHGGGVTLLRDGYGGGEVKSDAW